jgi:hypothetical protein
MSRGVIASRAEATGESEAMGTVGSSGLSCHRAGATPEEAAQRPSPLEETPFTFEGGQGLLCYGAPSARGRRIMGDLVPYGEPWRAGANEATAIHLTAPARVGGVALEAGSYSLYTVPNESEWEFIVNPSWERWGIPIDAEVRLTEIGSFRATPAVTDGMVETLTYTFVPNADGTGGEIVMEWESARLSFPVEGGGM